MNKLFSKIASLSVGLAMAVGVGVALGHESVREAKAAGGTFEKITSLSDLESGSKYLIVSETDNVAFDGSLSTIDKVSNTVAVSVSSDKIVASSDFYFTITAKSGGYSILGSGGKYIGSTSSNANELQSNTSDSYTNTITWNSDNSCFVIRGTNSYLIYNSTSGQTRYRFYKPATCNNGVGTGSYHKLSLFKEVGEDPEQDTLVVKLNDATVSPLSLPWSSTNSWLFYANDKDDKDINANWTSSDETVFTVEKNGNNVAVVTPVNPGTATLTASAEGFNDGTFELTVTPGDLESIAVSGSMAKTAYTTSDSWDPSGLVVTATYSTGYEGTVSEGISWSYNPAAPADGVTSVVATATFGGESASSAAQAVTVKVTHAGTAEDPFTVEEALDKAASAGTTAWVTKGIISYVKSIDTGTYGNAEYYISDDGTRNNELLVYRGKYLENAKFTEETAALLTVGKIATITGKLKVYNSTKEYDSGNYLLALEDQPTGDVDVVFAPSQTSIEIGATGTYTATSNTAGVVFTWSVDHPEVLTVDASTGEFEAVGLGVARVTVTATKDDKEGSTYADITVNGSSYMSVDAAVALAATVESGKTTEYYVYVEGYVKEFATSVKDGNPRAFDIQSEDQESSIMVYTNVNPYADFVSGLVLGTAIRVKAQIQNYNDKYELINPVKISSEYVAMSFAYELLELTDAVCKDYDGVTDNHDAIAAIWETLAPKYQGLNDAQKMRCIDPDMYGCGETVKSAMARYDYLTGKYSLTNFISGRTPVESHYTPTVALGSDNNSYIIIVVISAVSVMSFGLALFLRKKRSK